MAMSRLHVSLLAIVAIAMCASDGLAQQPTQAQQDAIRQSCRSDYQSRCSSVPAGGSAALQCLKDNMASLSPGCQSAVAATQGGTTTAPPAAATTQAAPSPRQAAPPMPAMTPRQEIAVMRGACAGDFRAHCPGVQLGGGRALACLADHRESLSAPCRNALASARAR